MKYLLMTYILLSSFFTVQAATDVTEKQPKKDVAQPEVAYGYGEESLDLTASASSVISGEKLQQFRGSSLSYALAGMLPGLIVEEDAGAFGMNGTNLVVRGRSTVGVSSNSPLCLVDGFQRSLDDVQIDDVESVTVIKDAATAIFGVRGANGVILVKTKRGSDSKIRFSVSFDQAFKTPDKIPTFVNSADFLTMYNQALESDGLDPTFTEDNIAQYRKGHSLQYPDVPWEKEVLDDLATQSTLNINAGGGTKKARYYVSLGYEHASGLFKDRSISPDKDYSVNEKLNKIWFRTNLDLVALKHFDINLELAGNVALTNTPGGLISSVYNLMYTYPQYEFPIFVKDGLYGGSSVYPYNPVAYLNEKGYKRQESRVIHSGLNLAYNFTGALRGLSLGVKYAYDNYYDVTESYTKGFRYGQILRDEYNVPILDVEDDTLFIPEENIHGTDSRLGYSAGSDAQRSIANFEAYLHYNRAFGKHKVNADMFYQQSRKKVDASSPFCHQAFNTRLAYNYDDRYIANFVLGYSGTEAFAKGRRFSTLPSASFAWVASNESFLKDSKTVDYLKFRTSLGLTANSNFGNRFAYRQLYHGTGSYIFGSTLKTYYGLSEGILANPLLESEKALKFDLGVDLRMWNLLSMSATYFHEKRYDILVGQGNKISSIMGANFPLMNYGETKTKGFELGLGLSKQYHDWGFFANFNLTWFECKFVDMLDAPLPEPDAEGKGGALHQYRPGQYVGRPMILVFDGFFRDADDIANSPKQQFGTVVPGDIKYKDINGDNIINDYDRVYHNRFTQPNIDMSLMLGVNFKGFDFSTYMTFQGGHDIDLLSAAKLFVPFNNGSRRLTTYVANRRPWTPENADKAGYPRLTTLENSNNYRPSTFWQMNGNTFRIKFVELGYDFFKNAPKTHFVKGLRLYFRADNVFTSSKMDFVDPASMGGRLTMKSYHIGVNMKF